MGETRSLVGLDAVSCRHPLPGGGERTALREVSLQVRPGEFLVVLGAAGAGKSTLAGLLAGVLTPSAGRIRRDGGSPPATGASLPVGLVTENPEDTFTSPLVREEMGIVLENLQWEDGEIDRAVEEMLGHTGLAPLADSHPARLSGGQKQLLAVASILIARPRLLVLDEPLSLLDHRGREEVSRLLSTAWGREGRSVVYLSSEVQDALRGDRVVVLGAGKVVWEGAPGDLPLGEEALSRWGLRVPDLTALAVLLDLEGTEEAGRLWRPGALAEVLCRSL